MVTPPYRDPELPFTSQILKSPERPISETTFPGLDQIPLEGMIELGKVFAEGEVKYGRDNWKKGVEGVEEYDRERLRHGIKHLMQYANGDRSEPHLAKVAWFCFTQIWRNQQREKTELGAKENDHTQVRPDYDAGSYASD